jgi:tRNA(Ile)-lysidine synthase
MALHWRERGGGERLQVAGRGVRKAAKALFQEHGIPPWQRPRWPFLYDEEDRLVAIPGIAVAVHSAVEGGWQARWQPRPAPWQCRA